MTLFTAIKSAGVFAMLVVCSSGFIVTPTEQQQQDVNIIWTPGTAFPGTIDVPAGQATASASGTIHAHIDEVWAVYRSFSKQNEWTQHLFGDWESSGDFIGATRTYNSVQEPTFYTTEVLVGLDEKKHQMRFDMVDVRGSSAPFDQSQSLVSFQANGDVTEMQFSSWTKSPLVDLIKGEQQATITKVIRALDEHMNPVVGTVDVTVKSVQNSGVDASSKVLAALVVSGSDPVRVTSKEQGIFDARTSVQFELRKSQTKFYANVMLLNKDDAATPVGYTAFDVKKRLTSGRTITKTLKLKSKNRSKATITLELELNTKQANSIPQSQAQRRFVGSKPAFTPATVTTAATIDVPPTAQIATVDVPPTAEGARIPTSPEQMEAQKKMAEQMEQLKSLAKTFEMIKGRFMTILQLGGQPDLPVWEYEALGGLPRGVKGLPRSEMLPPHKIGAMIATIVEYGYSQFKVIQRLVTPTTNPFDRYAAYFSPEGEGYVPVPHYFKDHSWATDDEFLRQVFSGVNPIQVQVVKNTDNIPAKLLELKAKDGSDVPTLIAASRLYMLDYSVLENLERRRYGSVLYAPKVLFYHTGGAKLDMLGIMLEPTREDAPVYTPNSNTPNKYLLAKSHVACADSQLHEFVNHLGYAHLGTEPMAIAAHNVLERNKHPLGYFLKPHFRDNIGINYVARQILVSKEGAVTDKTFAVGTKQGLDLVSKAFETYDFMESGLPTELKSRGFDRTDDLDVYHYRDDGLLVWDALWSYSNDMVNELYKTDDDVAADSVIQEWAQESVDPNRANIRGFPKAITSKQDLTKVLTTIVWQASALHTALNDGQSTYNMSPVNRSASLRGPVPDGEDDIAEEDILKAIPGGMGIQDTHGMKLALFQGVFSWLLVVPDKPALDEVGDSIVGKNNPEYLIKFRSKHPTVYRNLSENLAKIESAISKRNEGMAVPYDVLLPSNIAASTCK